MLDNTAFAFTPEERPEQSRDRFLGSHRAIAACAREFSRLVDEIVAGTALLRSELHIEEEADVRLMPDRCIIQLGPVALTVAWLRGTPDMLADGRLLMIAWDGIVAKRSLSQVLERVARTRDIQKATAVAVWERSFVAVAESEASWGWQQESDGTDRDASPGLAARALAQLRSAWEHRSVQ